MKLMALDLGDQWTGIALSDIMGLMAKPFKTVPTAQLLATLKELIQKESIQTIIVGLPITLKATESAQTAKVRKMTKELEEKLPMATFIFKDERLTSKQAEHLKKARNKEEKLHRHAIAAAFILQSYLDYLQFQKHS